MLRTSVQRFFAKFQNLMRDRIDKLTTEWKIQQKRKIVKAEQSDTIIYPLLQMGPIGVNDDDDVMRKIFCCDEPGMSYDIASGYFNLTDDYENLLVRQNAAQVNVLMASPQANGFFNGHGMSGYIPTFYVYVSKKFHELILSCRQSYRMKLKEYFRQGWTFHAKGIWLTWPGETQPSVTLLGSPNYGYRSVHRDLETQFVVVTEHEILKRQLMDEKIRLFRCGQVIDSSTFLQRDHFVPIWLRFVARFIRSLF